MSILVRNLWMSYGQTPVLRGAELSVADGELMALLGPSGSGKSSMLRVIAGLERPSCGEIAIEGRVVDALPPQDRGVGFVFQSYALFPHMRVAANVGFGLRVQGWRRDEQARRVEEVLSLVGLGDLAHRYPSELSGGQQQRVALARALAPSPRVLLLDEPFAAVDAKVREELRKGLVELHRTTGAAALLVTHDQDEAFDVAKRVAIMRDGVVVQVGTHQELLAHPVDAFVAQFLGENNVLRGTRSGRGVELGWGSVGGGETLALGDPALAIVRTHDVSLVEAPDGEAVVMRALPLGDRVRVDVSVRGEPVRALLAPGQPAPRTGQRVRVVLGRAHVFAHDQTGSPGRHAH